MDSHLRNKGEWKISKKGFHKLSLHKGEKKKLDFDSFFYKDNVKHPQEEVKFFLMAKAFSRKYVFAMVKQMVLAGDGPYEASEEILGGEQDCYGRLHSNSKSKFFERKWGIDTKHKIYIVKKKTSLQKEKLLYPYACMYLDDLSKSGNLINTPFYYTDRTPVFGISYGENFTNSEIRKNNPYIYPTVDGKGAFVSYNYDNFCYFNIEDMFNSDDGKNWAKINAMKKDFILVNLSYSHLHSLEDRILYNACSKTDVLTKVEDGEEEQHFPSDKFGREGVYFFSKENFMVCSSSKRYDVNPHETYKGDVMIYEFYKILGKIRREDNYQGERLSENIVRYLFPLKSMNEFFGYSENMLKVKSLVVRKEFSPKGENSFNENVVFIFSYRGDGSYTTSSYRLSRFLKRVKKEIAEKFMFLNEEGTHDFKREKKFERFVNFVSTHKVKRFKEKFKNVSFPKTELHPQGYVEFTFYYFKESLFIIESFIYEIYGGEFFYFVKNGVRNLASYRDENKFISDVYAKNSIKIWGGGNEAKNITNTLFCPQNAKRLKSADKGRCISLMLEDPFVREEECFHIFLNLNLDLNLNLEREN